MPYPAHALQNFKKQYGEKEGKRRFFAWKGANPGQYSKALKTAQKEGGSHVAAHSAGKGTSHVVSKMLSKKRKAQ